MQRRHAVIKKRNATLLAEPVPTGEGTMPRVDRRAPVGRRTEPVVTVRKNGDLVESIDVTCPCGHNMTIECLYDAAKAEMSP